MCLDVARVVELLAERERLRRVADELLFGSVALETRGFDPKSHADSEQFPGRCRLDSCQFLWGHFSTEGIIQEIAQQQHSDREGQPLGAVIRGREGRAVV